MASKIAPSPSLFYVSIRGHRLTGLVDGEDDIRHVRRPVAAHYRARRWDGRFAPDSPWLCGVEVNNELEKQGLTEIPTGKGENWIKRILPVRTGLRAQLYDGCVFEARTAGDAQAQYCEEFGVTDTSSSLYDTRAVAPGTRLGLADSKEATPLGTK